MSSISKDGKVVTIVNDEHDLFSTPAPLKKYFRSYSLYPIKNYPKLGGGIQNFSTYSI